jgi:hypothetical protein
MRLEKHMRRVIFVIAWLGFGYFLYQCCMKLLNDESLTNVRQLFYVSLQPGCSGFSRHMHAQRDSLTGCTEYDSRNQYFQMEFKIVGILIIQYTLSNNSPDQNY